MNERCKYHVCDEDDEHDRECRDWQKHQNLDGVDAQYPGMATAFEEHYGQSWTDPDWRKEAAVWAAAFDCCVEPNSGDEMTLSTALETALNRIEDILAGDDAQAFKEARRFLPVGRATLAALRSMPAEPVAWQLRHFFPEQGDTEWTDWQLVSEKNLFIWERRVKQMPDKYELRPLFATPHREAVRMSEAEIDDLPLPKEPDYDDKIKFARAVEQATAARLGVKMGDAP